MPLRSPDFPFVSGTSLLSLLIITMVYVGSHLPVGTSYDLIRHHCSF